MAGSEQKLATKIITEVSSPLFSHAAFANAILRDHPTHQQSVMRAVAVLIEAWHDAYVAGHYDARNQGTCESAYHMWQALQSDPIPLPYI